MRGSLISPQEFSGSESYVALFLYERKVLA